MPVKALFFDLGNTLVSYYRKEEFLPVLRESVAHSLDYLASHGLAYDFDTILERAIAQDLGREDHRVTPIEQRLSAIFPEPAVEPLMSGLVRTFMGPIFGTARVLDGAIDLLATLQARHLPLVLVSNTPWGSPAALWREHLYAIGIAPYFRELVFCMDVGWRKPDARIFHHALDKIGMLPEDVLFVGDDPAWDVAGAQGIGMPVVVVNAGSPYRTQGVPVVSRLEDILAFC